MRRIIMSLATVTGLLTALLCAPVSAQTGPVGRWEGRISIGPIVLTIAVVVSADGAGHTATIDIPQQSAIGLALRNVSFEAGKAHFELPTGGAVAVFDGTLQGDAMAGTFEQGPARGTFDMKRAVPQAPAPPPPYRQEEVKYQSGAVTLAGTLTIPESKGPHPAVVMITGSGPQNRDEEIFGFRIFGVIADYLTRHGIAVLRADDRGVGGSTGSTPQSTSADFADDAQAAVKLLQARPDIDRAHVGLMGHSEGGLIAPMVAARTKDVAFIILMSGPGLTGEQIMLAQSELIGKAAGRTDEQVKANQVIQRKLFAASRAGTGWDEAAAMIRAELKAAFDAQPAAARASTPNPDQAIDAQVKAQLASVQTPWFRYFLDFDPATVLEQVKCPVLALFGEHDLQVPAAPNRAAMEKAFAKGGLRKYRIEVFPRANHLYQDSPTGGVAEYATLKKEFVPGFLDLVSSWILEQSGRKAQVK